MDQSGIPSLVFKRSKHRFDIPANIVNNILILITVSCLKS
jgi:hypothetical protein